MTGPRQAGALAVALAILLVGCQGTLRQETGVVTSLDAPALGTVEGFDLRTSDGRVIRFDTRDLAFGEGFPASHLSEHQALAEPVRVTFRSEDGRNLVVRLDDAGD